MYVEHVLESIRKIETFVEGLDFENFRKNELVQSAVMRELEIIGEAAKKISEELKQVKPVMPWKKVVGMRDKLAHDYFEIDVEAVWQTIKDDLVFLKKNLLE